MTALETRILQLLTDDWQTRKQLAIALNRKRKYPSPSDIQVLNALAYNGLIEVHTVVVGAVKTRFEYRLKQD